MDKAVGELDVAAVINGYKINNVRLAFDIAAIAQNEQGLGCG